MRCRRSLPLTLAMLLFVSAPMLGACALWQEPGHLSVDLSALKECQKLGKRQPVPEIDDTTDYRDLSPEALAALKKANDGIGKRTKCEDGVIAKYANQK